MSIQSALRAHDQWDDLRRDVRHEHWRRSFIASLWIWFGAGFAAVSLALACYGLLGSFYPFTLVSYHFYLNFSGQNTHEYVCPLVLSDMADWDSYGTRTFHYRIDKNRTTKEMHSKIYWPCCVGRNL